MSDEHIQSVRIYVTTNEGRPYEVDEIVETRAELRLALARLSAQIEDELGDLLDGQPVTVEHEDDVNPGRATIAAHPRDIQATLTPVGDDTALWLPNDDGHGDGSRIYADQLADTIAVINRAAALIYQRTQGQAQPPEAKPEDTRPPRTVHTLGQHERNGLWQCIDPPEWKAVYAWMPRNPGLHGGDDSPAWHYNPGREHWSMAVSGTEDTTATTVGHGGLDSVTFVEVGRLQPDGTLTYFGADGSRWRLGGRPTDED